MTNRREFLEGVGWATVPLATGLPAQALASATSPFHAVLTDTRFFDSREFGNRMTARGASLLNVANGEITDLWLREIRPRWQRGPAALAGLTDRVTLFCLEQLAWSHGLRVSYHAEHVVRASGVASHEVLRCGIRVRVDAHSLEQAGSRWSRRVADVVANHRPRLRNLPAGPTCAGLEPEMPEGATLLTSWIIAPV